MQLQMPADATLPESLARLSGPRLPPDDDYANVQWLKCPDLPLDLGGPIDRPFERMGPTFANVPAIQHLKATASKYPARIAMSDGAHEITYSAFLARSLRLAQTIAETTREGEAVGSLLRTSVWQPIAIFACMAAGRPLVILNPRDPAQRSADIAGNARISTIIGQGDGDPAEWIRNSGLNWIDITRDSGPATDTSSLPPSSVDAPAVVLYTSGSTGVPKGVVNSQRSLLQRVQQYVDACHISAADVFMPLSGPTTIAGCREMLTALLTGARLHLVDVEAIGLRGLLRQLRLHQITITYIVPALLRAVVAAARPGDLDSLRVVRIGGEKVLPTDTALIRKLIQPTCLIQISYSSTETTGTQWFLPDDWEEQGVTVPVGYLLPGISFAVIDDDGRSARAGEVGELVIKSKYVLLGYWEEGRIRPMTRDAKDADCRLFGTGDLVAVDQRGMMRVVGRKGRQLKINGRRVEPAELETVLRRIPDVRDAVAIVTDAGELVVFAASVSPGNAGFVNGLRDVIRKTLPTSLHPTRLHAIEEMPRLPGGKIDLSRLKALDAESRKAPAAPPLPTANELIEAKEFVRQVWTGILGTPDAVGHWDEAGGDSLKLLRCVMELEELTGRELNMEAFTVDMAAADMVAAVTTAAQSEQPHPTSKAHLVMLPGSMGYGPSLAAFGVQLSRVAHVVPIRYPDLASTLAGCDSVDDMAELALQQINAVQPHGDIRLMGYSLGGGVAFELASRLIEQGRSVKFLGILDTNIGPRRRDYRETVWRTMQRVHSHRVTLYRMFCRSIAKCVARLQWQVKFNRLLEADIWRHLPETRFIVKLELEEILRMQAFDRWRARPKPRLPITGTIFACNRRYMPADLGWDSLFTRLEIVPIAGGHLDLVVEPHLAVNLPVIQRAVASSCC